MNSILQWGCCVQPVECSLTPLPLPPPLDCALSTIVTRVSSKHSTISVGCDTRRKQQVWLKQPVVALATVTIISLFCFKKTD
jgi:hypothetical protein